jgi:hypothetical protein
LRKLRAGGYGGAVPLNHNRFHNSGSQRFGSWRPFPWLRDDLRVGIARFLDGESGGKLLGNGDLVVHRGDARR